MPGGRRPRPAGRTARRRRSGARGSAPRRPGSRRGVPRFGRLPGRSSPGFRRRPPAVSPSAHSSGPPGSESWIAVSAWSLHDLLVATIRTISRRVSASSPNGERARSASRRRDSALAAAAAIPRAAGYVNFPRSLSLATAFPISSKLPVSSMMSSVIWKRSPSALPYRERHSTCSPVPPPRRPHPLPPRRGPKVHHLPTRHPGSAGGARQKRRSPDRLRRVAPGQGGFPHDPERLGGKGVARQDGRGLAERPVAGGAPSAEIVVVHRRQIIVDQRVGVHIFHGARERKQVLLLSAPGGPRREEHHRPDPLPPPRKEPDRLPEVPLARLQLRDDVFQALQGLFEGGFFRLRRHAPPPRQRFIIFPAPGTGQREGRGNSSEGAIRPPAARTPKWRWGPVARPLEPTAPILSPRATFCPSETSPCCRW